LQKCFFIFYLHSFSFLLFATDTNQVSPSASGADTTPTSSFQMSSSSWWHPFQFSVGNFSPEIGLVQQNDRGKKNLWETNPTLGFSRHFLWTGLGKPLYLWPELLWVLPKNGAGGHILKTIIMTRLDGGFFFHPKGQFRFGLGLQHVILQGKGGRASVQNGQGVTSFFVPSLTKYGRQATLDIGMEWFFHPQYTVRGTLSSHAPFESLQRSFSSLLLISWYLTPLSSLPLTTNTTYE
jgi:hypothetical protein